MRQRKLILWAILTALALVARAQDSVLVDSLYYRVELQSTVALGDHSPLWLNANRYGLSSLETANGYVRTAVTKPLGYGDGRKWAWGYGADVALAAGFTSTMVVQQAYVEGRWLHGVLTVGAKEQPMELKNQALSTGSQTLGINARPVPQVRLSLPRYWTIPGTRGWLALKGHLAYGKTTDDGWQRDFTHEQSRYTEGTLYHSKAGYMRIGTERINLEGGLEMATQFGGKAWMQQDGQMVKIENDNGWRAFQNALFLSGADATDGSFRNTEGNHVGSWVARLNINQPSWSLGLYADHFFEDHSMLFHYCKSGDGYFIYDFKDWMLGMELQLKRTSWLQTVVLEYLYTKYQGGPVYHDHTPAVNVQISGRDNYYNHHLYTGWQHWGQVMGNPLYLSPLYNEDRMIDVRHNRFIGWHLAFSGTPLKRLYYRAMVTWQKSYGTYYYLPAHPEENLSLLAEADYRFSGGWSVKAGLGVDRGKLRGDNIGLQLSVVKTGIWRK